MLRVHCTPRLAPNHTRSPIATSFYCQLATLLPRASIPIVSVLGVANGCAVTPQDALSLSTCTVLEQYAETGVCEPPFQQKPFISYGASHLIDWFDL